METNYNFHYAISLAQTLYDIEEQDIEELEEIGLVAYDRIGNRNYVLEKAIIDIDCNTGIGVLPCDANIIEAITYVGSEDWNYTDNIQNFGDSQSYYTENYIEGNKAYLDPLYISGRYVKYKRNGNKIYTNKGAGKVQVLYYKILEDEDGLPYLTEKEALAISEYIAFAVSYKKALRTNNKDLMALSKDLERRWLKHCSAARVPSYVNQNEMDGILNVQSSWNRKMYNKSYKPIM